MTVRAFLRLRKTQEIKFSHYPAFRALVILMNNSTATPWLTSREAASYLRIEPRTLLLWARQGKVKGYTLSGTKRQTWRFLHSDLDATLTAPFVPCDEGVA